MAGIRLTVLRPLLIGVAASSQTGQLGAQQTQPVAEASSRSEALIEFSTTEGTWLSLDVAPDGRTVAFELLGDIYTMPISGGVARAVISGAAFQSQPRYSADGDWLTFISDETGADNVWVARNDGTESYPLTSRTRATLLSPAWAADDSSIFVTVVEGGMGSQSATVWSFPLSGDEGSQVAENINGPPQPLVSAPAPGAYGPAPSPDGRYVYYTSLTPRPYGSRNGASSVVLRLDLASGVSSPVALDGLNAMKPLVSPNGAWLAYGAMKNGQTGLKVRDLESGAERWVVFPLQRHQMEGRSTRDVLPNYDFSPDSRSILIERHGAINRIAVESGEAKNVPFRADVRIPAKSRLNFPRRVETGPVAARSAQHLAVGPDGRSAFTSLARIWVQGTRGDRPERLTDTPRPREFTPAWSPDGRWIAYVTWDETGGALWKTRSDGSGSPQRLTEDSALWLDPAWTPDGSEVVALRAPRTSSRAGRTTVPPDAELVRLPADGGAHRVVAAATGGRQPHFGPDPSTVFLSAGPAALVSVDLETGSRAEVARLPASGGRVALRMSPDGNHLMASGAGGALAFAAPTGGFNGVELSLDEAVRVAAGPVAAAAWSADAPEVSWITGITLSRAAVQRPDDRTDRDLRIEIARPTPSSTIVLTGARVVPMEGYQVIERADIVIVGDRITAVGLQGSFDLPTDAHVVPMQGKTIVPGFIDVHAHFGANSDLLEPESTTAFANLAYGITSVRNPQAPPDVFDLADVVEADAVPSPRIFSTGPGLFGNLNLQSLEQTRATLARYRDGFGTHLLKSYLVGDRQQRQWVAEAAHELGMMPTTEGGADTKANLTHAIDGFSGNEHAVPVAPLYDDVVQMIARTGMTYTPTLVVSFGAALPVYRLLAEERPHLNPKINRWFGDGELYRATSSRLLWFPPEDYNYKEVGAGANAILQAGGNVALGGHGEVQGLSNHWEMELLAEAGMSNHDVLRVATIYGAEAIGYEQDLGSIAPGKLADLVVLDRDPLEDISATQDIHQVMKGGVLYEGQTLNRVWPNPAPLAQPWWLERADGPAGLVTAIDELVLRTMSDGQIPGAAVAVIQNGETLVSKGYGLANLETGTPVSENTVFQSGSTGKMFTAAGIMTLVEDGQLDLEDSIREYLPEAPQSWQPITLRHLLTHSSGIPDYTSDEFDYAINYSEDDLVEMASRLELEFPAGTRWNYSNTGYAMLGVLMSRVTGRPYWEFLRQRIFDPAGMPQVRINTESDVVPHRARGYLPTPTGWSNAGYVAPQTNTTADGSLLMNLHDLIAWEDVFRNRRVLRAESWDVILSPMTLLSGNTHPYGFGWFIEEADGGVVYQHSGAWQGFTTHFTHFVNDTLSIVVLANARSLEALGLTNRLAALVNPALAAPPPPRTPIDDPDPEATRYVAGILTKVAAGNLELSDFAFLRQTVFPRIRAGTMAPIEGKGSPDRLELLAESRVGDDRALQYWAWYGSDRFRIMVSLGPEGGLTALRVIPEPVS